MSRRKRRPLTPGQLALTRALLVLAAALILIGIVGGISQANRGEECTTYPGGYHACDKPPASSWPVLPIGAGLLVLLIDMVIDASLSKPPEDGS